MPFYEGIVTIQQKCPDCQELFDSIEIAATEALDMNTARKSIMRAAFAHFPEAHSITLHCVFPVSISELD